MVHLATRSLLVLFFTGAIAVNAAGSAVGFGIDPDVSFSGTRLLQTKDGILVMFVRQAPGMTRLEVNMAGQQNIVISRRDLGKNYRLVPALSVYESLGLGNLNEWGGNLLSFSAQEKLHQESINDVPCTKFKANYSDSKGRQGAGYYWVSDSGVLMKVDMLQQSRRQNEQRLVFEMRDVQLGQQPLAKFEVPADYGKLRKIEEPSGATSTELGQQVEDPKAEPALVQEVLDAVGNAAEQETKENLVDETRQTIRKGFSRLFRR